MRVIVIGAGIAGITTADALLSHGYSVTVVDRQSYPGMETSYANGGQLSASNAEVWNSWFTLKNALKWIFKQNAPLLLNLSPSWHKYSWLGEFIAAIPRYNENTTTTVKLALLARELLFEIAEREKIQFDLSKRGVLHFYRDQSSFINAERVNRLLCEGGLDRRAVTAEEIKNIEPALKEDFYGGFYTPSDATGDIHKFTTGLARSCKSRGAIFLHNRSVIAIDSSKRDLLITIETDALADPERTEVRPCDAVVICAGVGSRNIAGLIGDRVNIYPVKGYSITVCLDGGQSQKAAPQVSLLDDAAKIVTSRLGLDRFRVAGTAELNGFNLDIRADRVAPLIDWSRRLFPDMETRRIIPWAGLRPMAPDMMPIVRQSSTPRVFFNTGHGHLGWTLSAATAHLVTGLVHSSLKETARAIQY